MKKIALCILALGAFVFSNAQVSVGLTGTCVNSSDEIEFTWDSNINCASEPSLAGRASLGFHSGTSNFGGVVVNWDALGAAVGTNDGVGNFTWTVNPATYYGIDIDSLDNIQFVLNIGPDNPLGPFDEVGRDTVPGGFGCLDLLVTIADLPTCGAPPACSSATAPTGLSSTVGATQVSLNWTPITSSVACQVKGTRITPAGPSPSVNIFGSEVSSTNVPVSAAGAGTTWEWQARCACSVTPLDVTAFSAVDVFVIPGARMENQAKANIYPNPASDRMVMEFDAEKEAVSTFRVMDLAGRNIMIANKNVIEGFNQISFDVSNLESGVYFIQNETMSNAVTFTVE
ncbi:MAG: hypothetical protein ACI959_002185 [Limisphaerales bacterium]|jgi:hypothetical protein